MRFEDLVVWKRSASLSAEIYKHFSSCRDYGFKDQITRAGISIACNIAEGFERESTRECINFLSYAKGSCAELRTQVHIGSEIDYIGKEIADQWLNESVEISRMIGGLIKTKKRFLEQS